MIILLPCQLAFAMKLVRKANIGLDRAIDSLVVVACALLVFALIAVSMEIVFRYFLNRPSIWVVEVTEYILLYITFLGAAWLLKEEGHVKVDILSNRLDATNLALLNVITSVIGIMACLTITWYGIVATLHSFQRGALTVGLIEAPKFAVLLVIPIGGFMLSLQFLRRTHGYWKRWSSLRQDK